MKIVELAEKPKNIEYGVVESIVGQALVAWCSEGIVAVYFGDTDRAVTELNRVWRDSNLQKSEKPPIWSEITQKPIAIYGTPFQIKVWCELLNVNYGETISYSELAERIERPAAVRAVATAVGRNEISLIIPCHRIIHRDGSISSYRWGIDIKRRLLAIESGTTPLY